MQSSLARFTVALSTFFMFTCASLPAHADTAARTASNAPIPIGDFFNNNAFSGAVMSPDGRHLAVLVSAKGGRVQLYTVELAGMKVSGLTSFEDADIARIAWVNDRRIVYSVADRNIADGDVRHGPGLYAMNIDGSDYRQLASNTSTNRTATGSHIGRATLDWNTRLLATSNVAGSDDVFVTQTKWNGGYSTLMGLVNDPALFKCGINWVGVTDINMMRDGHWTGDSDLSESYTKYGMNDMVGDRVADAAQLKATSPVEQAARITQPLLLGYGGADTRVPISHGRALRDAVSKTNRDVEWVVYQEEGHGWALPKNNIDFWTRAEKLLQRSIGKPAVP